jgi:NAD dependent epimerase/dehydratase family enzyme
MILILGGSGFIGTEIVKLCKRRNLDYLVVDKDRNPLIPKQNFYKLDLFKENLRVNMFTNLKAVINLVGSPMMVPLSKRNKAMMYQSRVFITKKIVNRLLECANKDVVYIQASGVNCYEDASISFEDSLMDDSFLSNLVQDWEAAADPLKNHLKRVVFVRQPIVLGKRGFFGVFRFFKFFGLIPILKVDNFKMNFIDVLNLAQVYLSLMDSKLNGVLNVSMNKSYDYVNFNKSIQSEFKLKPIYFSFNFLNKITFGLLSEVLKDFQIASNYNVQSELDVRMNSLRSCILKYLK